MLVRDPELSIAGWLLLRNAHRLRERAFSRTVEAPVDRPFLNRRAEGYVGRIFTLDKPIVDGIGTIRIDDTVWRVSGPKRQVWHEYSQVGPKC